MKMTKYILKFKTFLRYIRDTSKQHQIIEGTKDWKPIFLHNMRSLPDHFRELLCYLDTLKFNFKVLALTETWLKSYHTNYVIPNYNFEQDLRMHSRGGEEFAFTCIQHFNIE